MLLAMRISPALQDAVHCVVGKGPECVHAADADYVAAVALVDHAPGRLLTAEEVALQRVSYLEVPVLLADVQGSCSSDWRPRC